jgi:hypothetical protein
MATQQPSSDRKVVVTAVFVVGIILVILSFVYRYTWVEPIATVLLFCVTAVYVLLTHDTLKVAEKQFELVKDQIDRQDRVLLFVDLEISPSDPTVLKVRVSNLGLSNILVQRVEARTSDDLKKTHIFDLHRIVESGKTEAIAMPGYLYDGESSPDFEFSVHYVGGKGTGSTAPKCFNVFSFAPLGADDEPTIVKDGLDANWVAACPKCNHMWPIDVGGLTSFAVAIARTHQVQEDMAVSCPHHKSDYMLSTETIRVAAAKRENRRKL